MGRRRKKGRPVHGWLILDKPYDFGSTEAVSKLRWLLNANKTGHAGTLDPLATGILPIAFGEATKTVSFVQDGEKTYQFTAHWGVATTSDDAEGEVIERADHRPTRADIEAVLPEFTGDIEQVPPAFSAVKIKGQRAYDLAREGREVKMTPRPVTIHELRLLDMPDTDHAVFEAVTSKGTYIRSLIRDIAIRLGTVAHVSMLRRTRVGGFTEDMAVTFEEMTGERLADIAREDVAPEELDRFLEPLSAGLSDIPSASISGAQAQKLRMGQAIIVQPEIAKGVRGAAGGIIENVLTMHHDDAVALCQLDGLKLQPTKVFVL
ncbi:MAG: tRNA pseudouridine(55) synthase TruB [bacterium]